MIREWLDVREQDIVESSQSESEICENKRPGTGWVVGGKRLGRKFNQIRVGGSNWSIMEQLGQQKTRDWVVVCEQVIREQAIGGREQSGSDCYGESYWGARGWGVSYWWERKFGRKWLGSDRKKEYNNKLMRILFLWHSVRMPWKSVELCLKHTGRNQDRQRHLWKCCRIFPLAVY